MMNRRRFLKIAGVAVGSAVLRSQAARAAGRTGRRPNILFIMADDHTSQAIGAYGSRLAPLDPTPVIDRLAAEGMVFENAFCNNSICTPSRASIITGQYPQTNGVLTLYDRLPLARHYLPREMKKMGYQTAMIGKWHLVDEPAEFDYYCVLPGQGSYFNPAFCVRGENKWPNSTVKFDGHSSDVVTDISLEWLESRRDKSKPFFLMHHFKAPHGMWDFAPRYANYLEAVDIPEPPSLYWWFDLKNSAFGSEATRGRNDSLVRKIGTSISPRLENPQSRSFTYSPLWGGSGTDRQKTARAYQTYLKRYLRTVKGVDDNVKRLFDYLESAGEMDNTIIFYTSDQGMMLGEHDYNDKRWMYEESMRMPLLVRYPNMIRAGRRSDLLINNTDFAPTMIDLAGGAVPGYMQGRSFAEELKGRPPRHWRDALYYRYWMHMEQHENPAHFGIRTKDYKLIFFYGRHYRNDMNRTPPAWELYDMKNDPQELTNLYGRPQYSEVVVELKRRLLQLRKELNETDEKYPEIQKIIDAHWGD